MSFTWEITETGKEKLADGEYLAQLKSIEEKINEYGNYIQIAEQLDGGRMRYEKFPVGHSDPKKAERAIKAFNLFCYDLTGFELGKKASESDLLSAKYILTIKNITFDNGNVWEKAASRVRVQAPTIDAQPQQQQEAVQTMQYGGIGIPQTPAPSNKPLNDEVPF